MEAKRIFSLFLEPPSKIVGCGILAAFSFAKHKILISRLKVWRRPANASTLPALFVNLLSQLVTQCRVIQWKKNKTLQTLGMEGGFPKRLYYKSCTSPWEVRCGFHCTFIQYSLPGKLINLLILGVTRDNTRSSRNIQIHSTVGSLLRDRKGWSKNTFLKFTFIYPLKVIIIT